MVGAVGGVATGVGVVLQPTNRMRDNSESLFIDYLSTVTETSSTSRSNGSSSVPGLPSALLGSV